MMSEVNNTDKLVDIEEVTQTNTEVTPVESLAEEPIQTEPVLEEVQPEVPAEPVHEEVQAEPEPVKAKPVHEEVHAEPEPAKTEPVRETPVVQEPVKPVVVQPVNPVPAPVVEKKKSHPGLMLLACAAIGLASGFGGGYLAVSQFGKGEPEVIIQEVPAEEPTVTNTASAQVITAGPTIKEVAAKASPSVVEINVTAEQTSYGFFGGTYKVQGAGSGVILSSDGYIITNNHVVEDAETITVTTYDGTEYPAELVGTDAKLDIGVIKIEATGLQPAEIGDSSLIEVGDIAVVIGNPLGTLGGTVTDGIISATNREIVIDNESMNLIQTNAAINNGNSGGGLFDINGNLVGIVNAKDSGITSSGATIDGLGFAIPINDAIDVAEQLIKYGIVTNRPIIGVSLQTLTSDRGQYKAGLYIMDITKGSGAEEAGLKPYDRITAADGKPISTYTDLTAVMRGKKVGDTIELEIDREGKQMTFTVHLTGTIEETQQG